VARSGQAAQTRELHEFLWPRDFLLAPVYGWFIEDFDARDLKEAKARFVGPFLCGPSFINSRDL
jgi:hypothetical protein